MDSKRLLSVPVDSFDILGNIKKRVVAGAVLGAFLFVGAFTAQATYMRGAASVHSTPYPVTGNYGTDYAVDNIINQSGLSTGYVNGVTDFDTYVASATHTWVPEGNEWWAPYITPSASVYFDLGESFTVDRVALWNEDWAGIVDLTISIWDSSISAYTTVGSFSPSGNVYEQDYGAEVFDFGSEIVTRFIRFDVTGGDLDPVYPTGDYPNQVTMGEAAFSVAEPVPEPATMLLFGTGVATLVGFRKKRS